MLQTDNLLIFNTVNIGRMRITNVSVIIIKATEIIIIKATLQY